MILIDLKRFYLLSIFCQYTRAERRALSAEAPKARRNILRAISMFTFFHIYRNRCKHLLQNLIFLARQRWAIKMIEKRWFASMSNFRKSWIADVCCCCFWVCFVLYEIFWMCFVWFRAIFCIFIYENTILHFEQRTSNEKKCIYIYIYTYIYIYDTVRRYS